MADDLTKSAMHLVQIVDAAVADSVHRSGSHLACRPGCAQCCVGVFDISQLDAQRLREGLSLTDSATAERIRKRVELAMEELQHDFPGDFAAGVLDEDDPRFEDFGNDIVCPVLDPETKTCDLYAHRPITCRTFGPPVPNAEGIGVCELCFTDATEDEIKGAAMDVGFLAEDERLSAQIAPGTTTIALALRRQ